MGRLAGSSVALSSHGGAVPLPAAAAVPERGLAAPACCVHCCRAQSRYREKQKAKAAAAEKEFADTARELERMRLENAQLQAGCGLWHAVLCCAVLRCGAMCMLELECGHLMLRTRRQEGRAVLCFYVCVFTGLHACSAPKPCRSGRQQCSRC